MVHLRLGPNWNLLLRLFCSTRGLRLSDCPALLAYFETGEAANRDVLAQLADLCCNQLRDADGLLFDEGLIKQAHFLVELGHLAFDDLLHDWSRLAGCCSLRAVDFLLALIVL